MAACGRPTVVLGSCCFSELNVNGDVVGVVVVAAGAVPPEPEDFFFKVVVVACDPPPLPGSFGTAPTARDRLRRPAQLVVPSQPLTGSEVASSVSTTSWRVKPWAN